jgi:hypothetical protein
MECEGGGINLASLKNYQRRKARRQISAVVAHMGGDILIILKSMT